MRKIYFRADGGAKMGLGHIIRTLALVEMLKADFECIFLTRAPLPTLKKQILATCHQLIELPTTNNDLAEADFLVKEILKEDTVIVLDGYHFITPYQQILKTAGHKVVCIDDIHPHPFVADAVINHAPGIIPSNYKISPTTQLYLGLDYSLLRKPFLKAAKKSKKIKKIENVFICFGGSDFNNISYKAIGNILESKVEIRQIDVVLGGANPHRAKIEDFIKKIEKPNIKIYNNLSATEMEKLMQKNDLAIVPASSILYEIVAVKMPVISGYYVDNQENIYHGFLDLGLIFGAGDLNEFTGYGNLIRNISAFQIQEQIDKQAQFQKGVSKKNFITIFKSLTQNAYSIISG